jgi:hypothetical protein
MIKNGHAWGDAVEGYTFLVISPPGKIEVIENK